ncbi:hypothetical protein CALVIDRAFT_532254 [Calocera viscosa TUFC12733]|uniref:Uncharacterized protein n=1 Tax=Calocera viscosa (strain TUFC12733) TaxID=1330018 RepID=A0A167S1G8_CALVF|nr:hypothetical protein CALVIDRAFT_532254 [Calocera viscosa TUFC12733]
MAKREQNPEAEIKAVNGDRLRINDHVYYAPPWRDRTQPYTIARIMEWLPEDGAPKGSKITRARLNMYYRANEPWTRNITDSRALQATMCTDKVPLNYLRGKCHVSHKDKINNFNEWRKTEDCFYYARFYDPYVKQDYEIILSSEVNNIPDDIKATLTYRYDLILTEKDFIPTLTDDIRVCAVCEKWTPPDDCVRCDRCGKYFHTGCPDPPVENKPNKKGWAWFCGPCSKDHREEVEQLGAQNVFRAAKGKPGKAITKTQKAKQDEKTKAKQQSSFNGGGAASTKYWKKWPYRYFGNYTTAEDILDPDDMIYAIARVRMGPKYQATSIPQLGQFQYNDTDLPERGAFNTVQALACVTTNDIEAGQLDNIMMQVLNSDKRLPAHPYSVAVLDEVLRTITFSSPNKVLTFEHIFHRDTTMTYPWKEEDVRLYDTLWTPEERLLFEKALQDGIDQHGQPGDLKIAQEYVTTKTRAEIVRYYGLWKNELLGDKVKESQSGAHKDTHKSFLGQPTILSATQDGQADYDSDTGSEADVPRGVKPICSVCKSRASDKWWKGPSVLPGDHLLCNNCSVGWRKYNDPRVQRAIEEGQSRVASDRNDGERAAGRRAKAVASKPASPAPGKRGTPPAKAAVSKPHIPRFCVCCKTTGPADSIARCQYCLLTVHPACVGFPPEEFVEPWTCDICANEKAPESRVTYHCLLCPIPDAKRRQTLESTPEPTYCRAMKPTEGRGWVHILCAIFTPEVYFTDARHMKLAEGISMVPQNRWKATCAVCNVSGHGACVKCADCSNEFHLSCAWLAGCTFGFEIQPVKVSRRDQHPVVTFKKETGAMNALVWCSAHDKSGRTIYSLGEVDPRSGLTAMQVFCRTYKQIPLETSFALLRKAQRLDQLMGHKAELNGGPMIMPKISKCRRCGSTNSPFYYPDLPEIKTDTDMDVDEQDAEENLLCHACYSKKIKAPERSEMGDDWEEDTSDYTDEEW